MPLLRQIGPIFTHHFTDYSLRHKLPTASYRHRAWMRDTNILVVSVLRTSQAERSVEQNIPQVACY